MQSRLQHGFAQSMRSTLSRRLTLAVFLGIMLIEVLILVPSYLKYRQDLETELVVLGQSVGSTIIALPNADVIDWYPRLQALTGSNHVLGAGLYRDGEALAVVGETPAAPAAHPPRDAQVIPDPTMAQVVPDPTMDRVDLVLSLNDATDVASRVLVLRLDSSHIPGELRAYVGRIAGMVMIIAAFVTLVTMAVVGRLVLLPLMELREGLSSMSHDGVSPFQDRHVTRSDELGDVFRAAEETRAHTTEAMREVEALARFPSENPNPVMRLGADGILIYANDAAREQKGFFEESGQPAREITDLVSLAAAGGMIRTREVTLGGRVFTLNAAPVRRGNYVNVYAGEVTGRVRAEQELRRLNESLEDLVEARTRDLAANEARLRTIIDTMVDGLIVIDETGRVETFNSAAQKIFGYSEGEILGQPITRLMTNEDSQAHDGHLSGYMRRGLSKVMNKTRQETGLRKDGTAFPMSLAVSEVSDPALAPNKRLFTGVMRDISDQIQREEDLRQARDAAEMANRAKTDFLATMSHELRTPLNGVIGMAELLRDTPLDSQQTNYAKTITESALALLAIINDILDLSKIEAGRLELDHGPFDPITLVESVANLMDGKAREKGLIVLRDLPARPEPGASTSPLAESPLVQGDEGRLRQVLLNLASNGVKFTERGTVTLALRIESGNRFRFEVRDTGIGIAEEDRERLFQDFSQVSPSTSRRYGGTGLGLAICKRLITMMNGDVGFDSWPGAGSLFWFEVPLPPVAQSARSISVVPQDTMPPLEVLVVEDNEINRQVAEGLLSKLGHRVTCVVDGHEAVTILDERSFDLVFMDVQMPGMDGYEATRAIRAKDSPIREVPIVAMTANATSADVEAAMLSGMDGYLSKPVTRKRIAEALAQYAHPSRSRSSIRAASPEESQGSEG